MNEWSGMGRYLYLRQVMSPVKTMPWRKRSFQRIFVNYPVTNEWRILCRVAHQQTTHMLKCQRALGAPCGRAEGVQWQK